MKVKINEGFYKPILSTSLTEASVDQVALAWVINRALASAGAPPMFEIDETGDEALVILAPAPDGYRGDMDALSILFPDVKLQWVEDFDQGDVHAVHRKEDGRLLGFLVSYYGNNGRGSLAAQDFDPAPGVVVRFES